MKHYTLVNNLNTIINWIIWSVVSIPIPAISVDIPAKEGFKRGIAIFHILTMQIFYFYERIVLVYDIQVHRLMEQGYNFNTYEDFHLYFFESEHN